MLNKLSSTLRRAATITRITAAARAVSRSSGDDRACARRALAALLADARGIPMKIGQFLAGHDSSDPFAALTSGVEPLPFDVIQPEIERSLGTTLDVQFSSVEPTGIAASLGQVHPAILNTGERVAVKVRYPRISEAVEAELRLARLVPGLGPVRAWGFNLQSYNDVLTQDLRAELDYCGELDRQQFFFENLKVTGLVVPRTYPRISSESVLVQAWEDGVPIESLNSWAPQERRHVGVILMCTLFQSLFIHGEVHGDPHSGNYRFRRNASGTPEVILLDYGCVVHIPRSARLALLKLILGAIEKDDTEPVGCFHAMGFDPAKLRAIEPILPALSTILLEPFLIQVPFQTRTWELGNRVELLLGELKWWFRSAGPADLLLLLRAFRGLLTQLEVLDVALPWQSILFRVVNAALREEARAFTVPKLIEDAGSIGFSALANYLRVRVCEKGHQVVAVTLPASQTLYLNGLIPEETLERIRAAGIDIAAIQATAVANGLKPQDLFQFDDGERHYHVWLD